MFAFHCYLLDKHTSEFSAVSCPQVLRKKGLHKPRAIQASNQTGLYKERRAERVQSHKKSMTLRRDIAEKSANMRLYQFRL